MRVSLAIGVLGLWGAVVAQAAPTPTVSPPVAFGSPISSPTGADIRYVKSATIGSTALVAWSDTRGMRSETWGTLVDVSAPLVRGPQFEIAPGGPDALVTLGTTYFVFSSRPNLEEGPDGDAFVRRFDSAGQPLEAAAIQLPIDARDVAAASDGNQLMVAWRNPSGVFLSRMSSSGQLLDSPPVLVRAGSEERDPAIAFDGSNFLVTWATGSQGNRNVVGRLVSPSSVFVGAQFTLQASAGEQGQPSVVWSGTSFVVAWTDGAQAIRAARVSSAGAPLDAAPGVLVSSNGENVLGPRVAPATGGAEILWSEGNISDSHNLAHAFFANTGVPSATELLGTTSPTDLDPALVTRPGGFAVFWSSYAEKTYSVRGTRLDSSFALLEPIAGTSLSTCGGDQHYVHSASDGSNTLVVWNQTTQNGSDVLAARVDEQGQVLDNPPLILDSRSDDQGDPRVAWNGSVFLVVWSQWDELFATGASTWGRRVAPNGTLPDAAPFFINFGGGLPDLASDGSDFLLTYVSRGAPVSRIYAQRMRADGSAIDPSPFAVSGDIGRAGRPRVAFGQDHYVVAWSEGPGPPQDIFAARVMRDGTLPDGQGVGVAEGFWHETDPVVGFDGTSFLVAWSDWRAAVNGGDIYGRRISNGAFLDPGGGVLIVGSPDDDTVTGFSPVTTDRQLMAWYGREQRRTYLSALNGTVASTPLELGSGHVAHPSVNTMASGRFLYAYSQLDGSQSAYRLRASVVTGGALGNTCTEMLDCAQATCTAGLCTLPDGSIPAPPPVDAGIDAGSDAGTAPGTEANDAGTDPSTGAPGDETGGELDPGSLRLACGCHSAPGAMLWLGVTLLGLLSRRRR